MATLKFYVKRIKEGRLKEMIAQTKWIYGYAKKYWLAMIFYTALGLTATVIGLLQSLVSRDMVDIITGYKVGEIIKTFLMMIGLAVGTTVLNKISDYASSYISMKVDSEIKGDIFAKILETDWESLTKYHTGDLLTRWSSDASAISSGVLSFIPNTVIMIFRFFSAFAMVVYYDWTFAIFAFLNIPVNLLLSKRLIKRMMKNNKRSAQMSAKMSGFNQETFSNIQVIKSFDLIEIYKEKLSKLQKDVISMKLEFQRMSMGTGILMTFVTMTISYLAYGWGIYRVFSGAISYGSMTMFLGLSGQLTGAVSNLTSLVPSVISLTTSAQRLMDIVDMPREDYSHVDEVDEFADRNKNDGVSLELKNVVYSYKNGNQVFADASMIVRPHEAVALVGPSGEGKTTMMRVLLSLVAAQGGEAYVFGQADEGDRIDLSPSTRRLFSYVPQGNTMLSGTIAENMRNVKPDATDEEIVEALKKACAWEFIEKLPKQIYAKIQEKGGGFSEGQAQRLSIARSMLRHSPILLLDEATSALDSKTEKRVLDNIMADEYPRACIVTTHRPSVLLSCDRVYEIHDRGLRILSKEEVEDRIRNG